MTSVATKQVWSVRSHECYAMSERHSLAPGQRGQVESCGPVAKETDFTARWKATLLCCQQACYMANIGHILYGTSHWNTHKFYCGSTCPCVTEAQLQILRLPKRFLCAQNAGTLIQIYKKQQHPFFARDMAALLVSTTSCKGKGHPLTGLCRYRGETQVQFLPFATRHHK